MKVFTVTFDQFNSSLLNTSINLHKKTDPKLYTIMKIWLKFL